MKICIVLFIVAGYCDGVFSASASWCVLGKIKNKVHEAM